MSCFSNVSPYRMGEPRFGTRTHEGFDNSVKTYKLSDEELKEYRKGKVTTVKKREETTLSNAEEKQKPKVIAFAKYEKLLAENEELKNKIDELQSKHDGLIQKIKELEENLKDQVVVKNQDQDMKAEIENLKKQNDSLKEKCYEYEQAYNEFSKELRMLRRIYMLSLEKQVNEGA